jgi:mannitol-1-phosphate/altronate dehydrogenase
MYDKSDCQTGIVHIGYGAFHRAHQAMYIDEYMEKTGDLRWGIVAVNLRDEGFREIDDYIVKTPSEYKDCQVTPRLRRLDEEQNHCQTHAHITKCSSHHHHRHREWILTRVTSV